MSALVQGCHLPLCKSDCNFQVRRTQLLQLSHDDHQEAGEPFNFFLRPPRISRKLIRMLSGLTLSLQACVLPPGNNLGVCCMDVEEIVKGIDPGLQDVFLEKVVEEVTEVLNSNAIRTEESREEDVISVELGGEEFDVDEVDVPEGDDLFIDKTALPEEAELKVNEDENKVTITLRDEDVGDGGTAKEVLDDEPALADLEPLVEINLNVLRTRSDLAKAMKVNRDPKSRVRFVSQPSSDEVDYLDFDNDYNVITLENDYDYDSFLRASRGQLRTPRRRRPLRSRRPQARRVFIRG